MLGFNGFFCVVCFFVCFFSRRAVLPRSSRRWFCVESYPSWVDQTVRAVSRFFEKGNVMLTFKQVAKYGAALATVAGATDRSRGEDPGIQRPEGSCAQCAIHPQGRVTD